MESREEVGVIDYKKLIDKALAFNTPQSLQDAFDLAREFELEDSVVVEGRTRRERATTIYNDDNFALAHEYSKRIRAAANKMVRSGIDADRMLDLYYKTHLFDAPHFFDSFCLYIEKDRDPKKQFYMPRRKQLKPCADALQDLEDGKLTLLGISEPPGVGKSTLAEFFL